MKKTFLIVSNGYGEDLIGERLAVQLKRLDSKLDIKAAPLVGSGSAYSCTCILKSKVHQSGGFIRTFSNLVQDIYDGLLNQLFINFKTLQKKRNDIDHIIVVGDVFALTFSYFSLKKKCYFLPTAKSHSFMKHSWIEQKIIKKQALCTFPRDQLTAHELSNKLHVRFLGNPMMDMFETSTTNYGFEINRTILGILPGSRSEWTKNLVKILRTLDIIESSQSLQYLLCLHKTSDLTLLSKHLPHDWTLKPPYLIKNKLKIVITHNFGDFLSHCWAAIGLAGTANEQAHHCGIPIFSFEGEGPQSTKKRFLEQKKLLQHNYYFIDTKKSELKARRILELLPKKKLKIKTNNNNASLKISQSILQQIRTSKT